MIPHLNNLKVHLQNVQDGVLSETDLAGFVQLARAIAQAYLRTIRASLAQLCLVQGLTLTDLGYDCIAEAFAKDERNRFSQIDNFISSLDKPLADTGEHDVFLAFKSFMLQIADAQLARLYAQSDPAGAKIHRNIRDCAKQSTFFCIKKDFRGMVLMPHDCNASEHLPPFPPDELEREFRHSVYHETTIGHLLSILHDILKDQSAYRRSVPVVDVVQIFRRFYRGDAEEAADVTLRLHDGLTEFEIDRMRRHVELALKEKILLTYLARGKTDRRQAEAMAHAFEDMIADWCNGEESQTSLYGYVNRYSAMDEATYESTLRPKMEYLLKVAREEFAARLMKEI